MTVICLDPIADVRIDRASDNISITMESHILASVAAPFYFGPEARPLFGWFYAANPSATAKTNAVVLCMPIGYEALCAHAYYRYLAERLSEEGYPVLRFDYDGAGDSFGSDDDADRVDSWIASIGFAIDTVRARSGLVKVSLFGMRLGATLATVASAMRGDVNQLALWAPCRSGRSYLREMRILKATHRGGNGESLPGILESADYEEAAGFVFTSKTVENLMALDATSIAARPANRVLIVGRDDLPNDAALLKRFMSLGTQISAAEWTGFGTMMRDPQETQIPMQTVDSLIEWLSEEKETATNAAPPPRPTLQEPRARLETLEYTEEPIKSEAGSGIFGILSLPNRHLEAPGPTILLLSVGANPHVGPNRMYVALARRLAAAGYAVMRLDVPGIGDNTRGCRPAREHIYSDVAIDALDTVLRSLERTRGTKGFVLVGLCSGAYLAYKVAAADPTIIGQILINPQTYEWNEGDSIEVRLGESYKLTRDYATAILDPKTLKRILTKKVNFRGVSKVLFRRLLDWIAVMIRHVGALSTKGHLFETDVCDNFRSISKRGARTLFLFSEHDFGIEATARHLGLRARKLKGFSTIDYETIDGADHTFTQKTARDRLLERIREHIETAFS